MGFMVILGLLVLGMETVLKNNNFNIHIKKYETFSGIFRVLRSVSGPFFTRHLLIEH